MLINALRNFDANRFELEDLIELSAIGRLYQTEAQQMAAEEPEWLSASLREVRREIRTRQQDALEKNLKEKKARLQALKPAEQRRAELAKEIEELEAKLK